MQLERRGWFQSQCWGFALKGVEHFLFSTLHTHSQHNWIKASKRAVKSFPLDVEVANS